jgi:4-hydroxy-2-oxoheptanedioate aldolase
MGNALKASLAREGARIGLWLGLADATCAELCATAGFDWLVVDGEHAPNDLRSTLAALQAVAPYPTHPVVRLPRADDALIKQVLEIGATTLLVPMVEDPDAAGAIVRAMRYPPRGIRGVGAGLARSSRWNAIPDYVQHADEGLALVVQVETVGALSRLESIAAVDGVDGVLIGPSDLAASMGLLGQPAHPDVRAAIEDAIVRIRAAGKAPGVLATDEAFARRCIALGAKLVAVGIDATLLAQATRTLARRFKPELESNPGGQP